MNYALRAIRSAQGEICPVGECPECGALAHYQDEEEETS